MRSVTRTTLVVLVTTALASAVMAQTPPPLQQSTPTEAIIEAQLRSAERPETAVKLAAFKRNLYEALLKKGFTGDQAMQITIATPLPSPMQTR